MTAERDDTPVEPSIAPASSGKASEQPARSRPPVIEQLPEAQSAGLGALLRPLAAGLVAGLLGGGIVSLLLAGGGPKPDDQARLLIKDLQDKIRDQQDKTAQLSEAVSTKLGAPPVKAASPEELSEVRSRVEEISKKAASPEELNEVRSRLEEISKTAKAEEELGAIAVGEGSGPGTEAGSSTGEGGCTSRNRFANSAGFGTPGRY